MNDLWPLSNGREWIEGVVSCGLLDFFLCSVGDLNRL
jgi:hypothetical protein